MIPKLLFIDIDNTLLDFDAYVKQTMKTGFEHFGLKSYEPWMYDVFTEINNRLWRKIEDGTLTFENLQKIRWKMIFEKLDIDFNGPAFECYFRKALNESAIPVAGAYEMLEELYGKYIICAASNGPYNQQVHRIDIAGMSKYFNYMFISEDIGVSKPDKAFFDIAFQRINEWRTEQILPEQCAIIGDSMTSDMAGGKACGMRTCFFRRDNSFAPNEGSVDMIADCLTDVPGLLTKA